MYRIHPAYLLWVLDNLLDGRECRGSVRDFLASGGRTFLGEAADELFEEHAADHRPGPLQYVVEHLVCDPLHLRRREPVDQRAQPEELRFILVRLPPPRPRVPAAADLESVQSVFERCHALRRPCPYRARTASGIGPG